MTQHGQWKQHHEDMHGRLRQGQKTKFQRLLEKAVMKRPSIDVQDTLLAASPLHHAKLRTHDVPFLIVHGTKDVLVPIEDSRSDF
jgi:dipeptidyl aminopeptidase/acylaminoacyl peptidase